MDWRMDRDRDVDRERGVVLRRSVCMVMVMVVVVAEVGDVERIGANLTEASVVLISGDA